MGKNKRYKNKVDQYAMLRDLSAYDGEKFVDFSYVADSVDEDDIDDSNIEDTLAKLMGGSSEETDDEDDELTEEIEKLFETPSEEGGVYDKFPPFEEGYGENNFFPVGYQMPDEEEDEDDDEADDFVLSSQTTNLLNEKLSDETKREIDTELIELRDKLANMTDYAKKLDDDNGELKNGLSLAKKKIEELEAINVDLSNEKSEAVEASSLLNNELEETKKKLEKIMDETENAVIIDPRIVRVRDNTSSFTITVDDGTSAFTINTAKADKNFINLDVIESWDDDDIGEKIMAIINFIISTRYPFAIFELEEFFNNDTIKHISEYHDKKFLFFNDDKYVFAYIVDTESFADLDRAFQNYNYDVDDTLRIYISMALEGMNVNNKFAYDDEFLVSELYNNASFNHKDDFIDIILLKDKDTVMGDEVNDDDSPFKDFMQNIVKLHHVVPAIIGEIVTENAELADEDEEDDTEVTSVEETVDENEVDPELAEGIEEFVDDEPVEEESETKEEDIKVIKGDNKKSSVVKVIR